MRVTESNWNKLDAPSGDRSGQRAPCWDAGLSLALHPRPLHLLTFLLEPTRTGGGLGAAIGAYSVVSGGACLSPVKTMALAAQSGALMGGLVTPVGPYWSETNLSGHPYQGITATGAPLLCAFSRLREPVFRLPRARKTS